ncbi:MAG: hypothetical protein QM802_24840 [Agriterribacter sp.]
MKWIKIFILKVLLFSALAGPCQTALIDSLLKKLSTPLADTESVNIFNMLNREFINRLEEEKALEYAKQALALSEKIGFQKGIANAHMSIGNYYWATNQTEAARKEFLTALKIFEISKDTVRSARAFFLMSHTYMIDDNYGEAVKYMYNSLRYYDRAGDQAASSEVYVMIGLAQLCLRDTAAALVAFNKNQEIFKKYGGSETGYANSCLYLGEIDFTSGFYEKAKANYEKALYYYSREENENGVIDAESKIAALYDAFGRTSFC